LKNVLALNRVASREGSARIEQNHAGDKHRWQENDANSVRGFTDPTKHFPLPSLLHG